MKKGSFSQIFTLVCYAVAIGAELAGSFILSSVYSEGNTSESSYIYLSYLLPQVCYLVSVFVFILVQRIPFKEVFRPQRVRAVSYLYALMIGLGLFFFALLPNFYLQKAFAGSGTSSSVLLPPMSTPGEIVLAVLLICILPALGEEMMFRKTFCEGMKGNNEWVTVLLGGLFFSLTHYNLVQTVHQFVLGCVLCFLYVRTENITLTMMIHFLNNLFALFLESWTPFIDWGGIVALSVSCAAGIVLLAGGGLIAFKKTKAAEGEEKVSPYTIGMLVFIGIVWAVSVAASFF